APTHDCGSGPTPSPSSSPTRWSSPEPPGPRSTPWPPGSRPWSPTIPTPPPTVPPRSCDRPPRRRPPPRAPREGARHLRGGGGPPAHRGVGPHLGLRRDHGRADPRQGSDPHRHLVVLVRP